ncbi:uncharacterized protein LOC107013640 [Solanum pennellii]|uniref:Uncharacterized protein LOC107013640 n=1 Tax=Solanum pennellii TaxID=28526 RepID=A0ABM1GCA3_SOLPN|nr:uncharacterized protein LOC107013640 [Solanum pennellii]XP_015069094.1 uncharacterized protein LOC107013640 [Solanum pennellii]
MGEQTVDSKSSDQINAKSGFGLPKHDKQLSVPVAIVGPALQDSQSESVVAASKSTESPPFPEANTMANKVSNITGSKRPTPECLVNPLNRCSTNNSGSGHLVYVRRRPEGELSKTAANNSQSGVTDYPQLKKLSQHAEKTQTEVQMKEGYYIPEVSSISWTPSRCSLSTKPSVPPSTGEPNNNLASVNVSNHQVTSTRLLLDNPKKVNFKHWEERYFQLQNLLHRLEHSKQEDYVQMLRSLSSVDLSNHAVELEKRSIRLALEEAKEAHRVRVLDILGKYPKNPRASLA